MKQTLFAIGAVVVMTGSAYGQADTPKIDERQANQERRIDEGIASGQLNQREAAKLDKQQDRIDNMENKAKSDGAVTKKERARLRTAQDRASKNIARQKHDRQEKRHQ